jgi:hypothetical protein
VGPRPRREASADGASRDTLDQLEALGYAE